MNKYSDKFAEIVSDIKKRGLYPEIPIIGSAATEPRIQTGGADFLSLSTNNYLGMSSHPEVKKSMIAAVEKYGMGSGGPRLLSGNIDVHNHLEKEISSFVGKDDAICFTTGYMGNIGTIPAITNLLDTGLLSYGSKLLKTKLGIKTSVKASIISDEKNHGSIIDGIKLSGAEKLIYKHCDMQDLESKLKSATYSWKLIITDGIFSMDGDIAPLREIVALAKKYDAMLMVDDAHGIGIMGENGRGTLEHFGVNFADVDIILGTFTKAFGGIGGFVAGNQDLIDYLRITARTYILSAPLPPSVAAGLTTSVQIVRSTPSLRRRAWDNAEYFRTEVAKLGFKTFGSKSLIIPVGIGDENKAIEATKELFKRGIIAPNARFPAVARGNSRLRFVMTSTHTKEDIDTLLKNLGEVKVLLKI